MNKPRHIEDDHQKALFQWAALKPELASLFAVPNGGKRHPREAARLKAQGVKSGVPDIFLPLPSGRFHGLFIELKRPIVKGEARPVVSKEQGAWLAMLAEQGYRAEVCHGWFEAQAVILDYLRGRHGDP